MNAEILKQLSKITEEEQKILDGQTSIDHSIYSDNTSMVIDSAKLLKNGKLIQVRPNTRFIHFPEHRHNYVEMIYMCSGQTHHIINGKKITLSAGNILLLNQDATQEVLPANIDDIAINFIILPEFFDQSLNMLGAEGNLIRDFIIGCLKSQGIPISYLVFEVADVLPIQNLTENLIWTILNNVSNKRLMNQITMGLLFLQLVNNTDKLHVGSNSYEQELLMNVLEYIEGNYRDGQLQQLAYKLNCDITYLSKTIKKISGSTYMNLLQTKRLKQACFLLSTSSISIIDISLDVGYENFSYFHRLFKKTYNLTPRKYRIQNSLFKKS